MASPNSFLPPALAEAIERTGISTSKIITLSVYDLKKLTCLCIEDILLLKNLSSNSYNLKICTGNELLNSKMCNIRIRSGCNAIDELLRGGYRKGTITEIYGESGVGKTQLAIQTVVNNWMTGCVYICTEDSFPIKRFEQMKKSLPDYMANVDYGKNVFVEHLTEPHELLSCIKVRLNKLLSKHKLSLIVIDSIAAPFRSEITNYVQRAEELRELAISLIKLAQEYELAILCINQVTSSFDESNNVLPSLGLAWSNMVSSRLCLKKTTINISNKTKFQNKASSNDQQVLVRELSVVFAPDLPTAKVNFIITPVGIVGT